MTFSRGKDPTLDQGNSVRKKEQQSLYITAVLWNNCNLHSPFHCVAPGEEEEQSGVKLSLGRGDGEEKVVLILFSFISILLC